jgi:hypothetical protein
MQSNISGKVGGFINFFGGLETKPSLEAERLRALKQGGEGFLL